MSSCKRVRLIHVGDYLPEVVVELIADQSGWSPYLSLADARKVDRVRRALEEGHLADA